ncbi:Lar family restriction alleviation protein [Cupriavidus sp. JZ107]
MAELKPCPFCGGAAEMYYPFHLMGRPGQPATYRGGVRCTKCGCQSGSTNPPADAIAAWNRRATDERRDTVRKVLERIAASMRRGGARLPVDATAMSATEQGLSLGLLLVEDEIAAIAGNQGAGA